MITNQPVVDVKRESPHIATSSDLEVAKGDAVKVGDPRLNGDFDPNSVRKDMEIARACATRSETKHEPGC